MPPWLVSAGPFQKNKLGILWLYWDDKAELLQAAVAKISVHLDQSAVLFQNNKVSKITGLYW